MLIPLRRQALGVSGSNNDDNYGYDVRTTYMRDAADLAQEDEIPVQYESDADIDGEAEAGA